MSESGSECIIETINMIHKKYIKEGKVVCHNCLENKKMRKIGQMKIRTKMMAFVSWPQIFEGYEFSRNE